MLGQRSRCVRAAGEPDRTLPLDHRLAGAQGWAFWSSPPFPKNERLRLIVFPIEEIVIAGPRVDYAPANLTAEPVRMLVWMLLPRCGVREPAIGTAKIFGRPCSAGHPAFMRIRRPLEQEARLNLFRHT